MYLIDYYLSGVDYDGGTLGESSRRSFCRLYSEGTTKKYAFPLF